MRRGRILFLFALILILGAVVGYVLLTSGPTEPPPEAGPTPVPPDAKIVIASQNLPRGAKIPIDAVIESPFPSSMIIKDTMLTDINQVVNHYARQDIPRGVPITSSMITQDPADQLAVGSDAALRIEQGMTAIAIPMTRLSGVAYALRDGDTVDVLISMLLVDIDPELQTILPNLNTLFVDNDFSLQTGGICRQYSQSPDGTRTCTRAENEPIGRAQNEATTGELIYMQPAERQRPRLVTQRLVEKAIVLHLGNFPLPEEYIATLPATQAEGEPPAPQVAAATVEIKPPDIVTLIVKPQEALAINFALKSGADLVLTLRAPNDNSVTETTSVTLEYLFNNFNIAVPPNVLPYTYEPRVDKIIPPVLPNDATPVAR